MNKTEIEKIVGKFESHKINVIFVSEANFAHSTHIKGDLDDFIRAVKSFGESIVFAGDFSFSESYFFHEVKRTVGTYEIAPTADGINLTQFLPELKSYETHFGETVFLNFWTLYKNRVFSFIHQAEWFSAFSADFERAQALFEEVEGKEMVRIEQLAMNEQQMAEERRNRLREILEELSADRQFIALKPQKAQQEYAILKYPELGELSASSLKEEISNLNARLQARKILSNT